MVLGMALAYALCARLRAPRAGVALAALLAVHPWSVVWSRVAVAPYALSLVTAVAGTLAVAIAWGDARRPLVARVLAAQLLALGFHFSPLALIPALASAVWIALYRKEMLRDRGTLLAGGLALAHVAPIALAALRVTAGGSTRPSGHLDHFRDRIANYAMTLLDGMSGEATARDFAGVERTGPLGWAVALAALGVIAWSLRAPKEPAHRDLHSLARVQFVMALPGIALLLAPMRQWHLPSVDAERYAFALLAPAMVLLALTAERARGRHVATGCALWLALSPTARMGAYFLHGGSPDRGVFRANGGGAQRRWKVSAGRVPVAEEVLLAADALGNGRAVTVVVADYVLHPIHFFNRARPHTVVDASFAAVPRRPGAPVLFARWGDGVFARGFAPREMVSANESLGRLMHESRYAGLRHLRDVRQPDGTVLLELWAATERD